MPITEQSRGIITKAVDNALPEFKELKTQLPELIHVLDHEEKAPPDDHPFTKFHHLFFRLDKLAQQLKDSGVASENLPSEHEIREVILDHLDKKLIEKATADSSLGQLGWHKGKYFLLRHQGAYVEFVHHMLPDEESYAIEYKEIEDLSKKPSLKDYFKKEIERINEAFANECKEDHPYYAFSNINLHPESLTDLSLRKKPTDQLPCKGDVRKFLISLIDEHLTKTLQTAGLNPLELGWDRDKQFNRKLVDDDQRVTGASVDWEWHIRRESRRAIVTQQLIMLVAENYMSLCSNLKHPASTDFFQSDNLSILQVAIKLAMQNQKFSDLSAKQKMNLEYWGVVIFISQNYFTLEQGLSIDIGSRASEFENLTYERANRLAKYLRPEQWSTLNFREQVIVLLPVVTQDLQGETPDQAELLRQRIEEIRALSEDQKEKLYSYRVFLAPYITTLARFNFAKNLSVETIGRLPRFWFADHPEWIDEIAKSELTAQQLQQLLEPKVSWYIDSTEKLKFVMNLSNETFTKIPVEWWTQKNYVKIMERIAAGAPIEKFLEPHKVPEPPSLEKFPRCLERIAKGSLNQNGFLNLTSSDQARLEEVKDDKEFSELLNKIVEFPENRVGYYFPEVFRSLASAKPDRLSHLVSSDFLFNLLRYEIFNGDEFCEMSDKEFELWRTPHHLSQTVTTHDMFGLSIEELRDQPDVYQVDSQKVANFSLLKNLIKNDLLLLNKSAWKLVFREPDLNPLALLKKQQKEVKDVKESSMSSQEQKKSHSFFKPVSASVGLVLTENPLLQYSYVKDPCVERISQRYAEIMKMAEEKNHDGALKVLQEQCNRTGLLSVLDAVKKDYAQTSAVAQSIVRPGSPRKPFA